MNFRFVTEIFFSESSIPTCEAYLLWLLEQHHYHHRNKFWELGFSFLYFLNQISGCDCKFTFFFFFFYIKSWIVNGLSKIYDAMKFEYWAVLFYFIFDWFQVEWFISFYFQVWFYFEASEILIENLRFYSVLGFWLQVLRVWISCLSENSSLRIVIE